LPHAEHCVQINRPPDVVFAFFADGENDPQWRPLVKEITRNGPVRPGMTYRQRVAGPGGRAVPSDFEVTAYEPDTHLAFRVTASPVRPVGDYSFRPAGDGTESDLDVVRRTLPGEEAAHVPAGAESHGVRGGRARPC
jgi:uncharacterized protein YndB with AHSA1/START domain